MNLVHLWQLLLTALLASAATPTRTQQARRAPAPAPGKFISTQGTNFVLDGAPVEFVGTNVYWLSALNSEEDIDSTLANISAAGITVVRTWAFNDVDTIPENGTWFQLVVNGTTQINEGPNGLQKLDTVVRLAEKHGIFLLLTLTNNWNPHPIFDSQVTGVSLQARQAPDSNDSNFTTSRNTLSNDYGGMDIYVRQFPRVSPNHDQFYTNPAILDAFTNYTTQIVSRYANSSSVFAWELANDPRCNSTLPSTNNCQTTTVTQWHSTVAQHVKSVDPNHLVTSGNQGFFCTDCPKLFPRVVPPTPPPPQPSPAPGTRRRRSAKPLSPKARAVAERKAIQKRVRASSKRSTEGGIRIRGRWISTETRRQDGGDQAVGTMDGSQGVDSEDIINIPQIGFGTFQLFPDQNVYGPTDPTLPKFNNTVNQGISWIQQHAAMGQLFNKPVTLNGFGLVTQDNAPAFVPFNRTAPIFVPDPTNVTIPDQLAPFVTDDQRDDAYTQWLQAGLQAGLQGMLQYQWSQANLTGIAGTAVTPTVTGTDVTPTVSGVGLSPNDGYGIQGVGQQQVVGTITQANQNFAPDTPTA